MAWERDKGILGKGWRLFLVLYDNAVRTVGGKDPRYMRANVISNHLAT
jgi:hypothetical protein